MTVAIIQSRAGAGIDAPPVTVEVHISPGSPAFAIVGLPETAVRESKDRVRSAILNSGLDFPSRRITVNLAPADLPKRDGGRFDLPIAIGILVATRQIKTIDLTNYEIAGELALDGTLRQFSGVFPFALAAKRAEHILLIPQDNAAEARLITGLRLLAPRHLLDVVAHLQGHKTLAFVTNAAPIQQEVTNLDLADVYGQTQAKRALVLAAAGGHSLLMVGPPGVGKTMLAQRLITILPQLTEDEALEVAAIYSICGKDILANWQKRPFRSPHHTISNIALVGGSSPPRPGEISLAHRGVLFLDEVLEFKRAVLETLREPLEAKAITISRAAYQARFPADFQLIIAMNPCPCGYLGSPQCNCSPDQVRRYRSRLSGPLLDRIDLSVTLAKIEHSKLAVNAVAEENSAALRAKVLAARNFAWQRQHKINGELTTAEVKRFCVLNAADQEYLLKIMEQFNFSVRSYQKILKVARTIADLAQSGAIERSHLREAILYRREF